MSVRRKVKPHSRGVWCATGGIPSLIARDERPCFPKEKAFCELLVDRYLAEAEVFVHQTGWREKKLFVQLAMDCLEASGFTFDPRYKGEKREAKVRSRALQVMDTRRFRDEKDRILARKGLTRDRVAATLTELMEGKGGEETRTYDAEGNLTERVVRTSRLKAADMAIRLRGDYAPTNSKVQVTTGTTYEALDLDNVPAIAVDPKIALEVKNEREQAPEEEDDDEETSDSEDEEDSEDDEADWDDEE